MKEGDGVIWEGKNIKLSHVNHVPNFSDKSNSVTVARVVRVNSMK